MHIIDQKQPIKSDDTKKRRRNVLVEGIKKDIKRKPTKDIRKFCKLINISENEFLRICEKFRNKKIWEYVNKKWNLKIDFT